MLMFWPSMVAACIDGILCPDNGFHKCSLSKSYLANVLTQDPIFHSRVLRHGYQTDLSTNLGAITVTSKTGRGEERHEVEAVVFVI